MSDGRITDELQLAEAVTAGAEFMDAIDVNVTDDAERWFWVVEPGRLSMRGSCDCVLGQHAGAFDPLPYGLSDNDDDDESLGFFVPRRIIGWDGRDQAWEVLTALWREEIIERRAAWFDAHPEYVIANGG